MLPTDYTFYIVKPWLKEKLNINFIQLTIYALITKFAMKNKL